MNKEAILQKSRDRKYKATAQKTELVGAVLLIFASVTFLLCYILTDLMKVIG